MTKTLQRGSLAAAFAVLFSLPLQAETIVKLGLGSTGPDIQLVDGTLSTVDDGEAGSPGDQESTVTFHGFVAGSVDDITPPAQGSFTLSGVSMVGSPVLVNQGIFSLVTQQTTGGTFELYGDDGQVLLTATLEDGSLHGTTSAAATGGFISMNLGTFTGPAADDLDVLFSQVAADTASLAISLTDVSDDTGAGGLSVIDNVLQNFTSDATANIGAESFGGVVPEPSSGMMALAGLALLTIRRRR